MSDIRRHLDIWSWLVILLTLVLFVAALFLKGLGHDLLLEAGVFLVSVKLIMMAYKNSVATTEMNERLDDLRISLVRIQGTLESTRTHRAVQPGVARDEQAFEGRDQRPGTGS